MPTYEYKCNDCGYKFEEFQTMNAALLTVCPKCSGHVKRLIGPGSGPIFKGSGFYQTDYKNKSDNPPKENKSRPAVSTTKKTGMEK